MGGLAECRCARMRNGSGHPLCMARARGYLAELPLRMPMRGSMIAAARSDHEQDVAVVRWWMAVVRSMPTPPYPTIFRIIFHCYLCIERACGSPVALRTMDRPREKRARYQAKSADE